MTVNVVIHGKGKPLVLFHGWGFDIHVWQSLLPLLTTKYQLYLVDLPGFGLTPPMVWENFKAALLKRLPQHFAVAGWSMGGLFATRLAIEETARVSYLLNIASSPRFTQEKQWPGVSEQVFEAFYQNLASNFQQTLKQFIELQLHGQLIPPVLLGNKPTLEGLKTGLDILDNWDFRRELAQLRIPVCYMFGRLDAITSHRIMRVMSAMYPHFNYILFAKAAHAPFLSHPSEFVMALDEFLQ